MAQVVMRAISCRLSVRTTLTSLATISPCRLKFTTTTLLPSGVTCAVAGKLPSMTCPAYALLCAVRGGHVVVRPIGGHGKSVRPVGIGQHHPHIMLPHDLRALRPELDHGHAVHALARDQRGVRLLRERCHLRRRSGCGGDTGSNKHGNPPHHGTIAVFLGSGLGSMRTIHSPLYMSFT